MSNEKLTRNQQREAARAKAKVMREAQKKNEARKKLAIVLSSIVGGVGIVAGVVAIAISNPTPNIEPGAGPATAIFDGGVRVGKDLQVLTSKTQVDNNVPNIVIYQDLQCPACKLFEAPNMPQIRALVAEGKYTVQIHPISFLDGQSVNEYSSRAASALLCVADKSPQKFLDYNDALYKNQPGEGTAGPSNEQLQTLAQQVGVSDQLALDCIGNNTWATWAKNKGSTVWTEKVPGTNLDFGGTPFVVVNGQRYQGETGNAAMFLQWLQTVAPVS
jgi:protein-disulfide isomerase